MRKHVVRFICDRCRVEEVRPGKSDGNWPAGWEIIDTHDLCAKDAAEYHDAKASLEQAFFSGAIINQPIPDLTKLTPRGRRVLQLAVEEMRRLNHHYLGTEHLLLGIAREGEGIAAGVLESQGVNLDKLRTAIEFIVGKGSSAVTEDVVADMDPETHPNEGAPI